MIRKSGHRFSEKIMLKQRSCSNKEIEQQYPREETMKKFYLSAAVIAASFALPGLPAMAQTSEITIGISISTTGPAAALGIPERNALDFVAKEIGGVPLKVIVLDDGGDPTNATTNARQRSGNSPHRPGAVSDHAGARQVVGRHAAAGPDHGQGAVRAHEGS
jgi:hypothetical protein